MIGWNFSGLLPWGSFLLVPVEKLSRVASSAIRFFFDLCGTAYSYFVKKFVVSVAIKSNLVVVLFRSCVGNRLSTHRQCDYFITFVLVNERPNSEISAFWALKITLTVLDFDPFVLSIERSTIVDTPLSLVLVLLISRIYLLLLFLLVVRPKRYTKELHLQYFLRCKIKSNESIWNTFRRNPGKKDSPILLCFLHPSSLDLSLHRRITEDDQWCLWAQSSESNNSEKKTKQWNSSRI